MTSSREGEQLKAEIVDLRKELDYVYTLLAEKEQYIGSLHKLLDQDTVHSSDRVICHYPSGDGSSGNCFRSFDSPTENDCHLEIITDHSSKIRSPEKGVKNVFSRSFSEQNIVEQFRYEYKKQSKLFCQRIDQLQRECHAKDITIDGLCRKIDKYRVVLLPLIQLFLKEQFYQSQLHELELAKLAELSLEIAYEPFLFSKRGKRQGFSAEPVDVSLIEECVGLIKVVPKNQK